MSAYEWTCGCGTRGRGETVAQGHAVGCDLFGYPAHVTKCWVTVYPPNFGAGGGRGSHPCGEPVVEGERLCEAHLAEKRRLS